VIIVTWNSSAVITGLLESLAETSSDLSWRALVVDNASSDNTLEITAALFPDAQVIQLGRNAGYAAGINAGLRAAAPRKAFVVVNPDVRFEKRLSQDVGRGACGPDHRDRGAKSSRRHGTIGVQSAARSHSSPGTWRLPCSGRARWRFEALGETLTRPTATVLQEMSTGPRVPSWRSPGPVWIR